MGELDFKKAIGYGVAIWILMFVVVSIFIGFNIYNSVAMQVVSAIIGGIIVYFVAGYVRPQNITVALSYGLCFVIVGLILDFLITMRFNPDIWDGWPLWLGYGLTLFVPILRTTERKS